MHQWQILLNLCRRQKDFSYHDMQAPALTECENHRQNLDLGPATKMTTTESGEA